MEPVHNKTTWSASWMVLAIIAVATAAILLSLVPAAQATAGNLPPRPTRTPTPTSTPTPTPAVTPPPPGPRPAEDTAPDGASIELQIQLPPGLPISAASQLWTVVQWQDSSGSWHAVDGWQGTPDQVVGGMATKAWWLPASLFGQGPFRWAVLEQLGGQRLSTSAPFSLPSQTGETLEIEIVY